jgi:hypothetical protein
MINDDKNEDEDEELVTNTRTSVTSSLGEEKHDVLVGLDIIEWNAVHGYNWVILSMDDKKRDLHIGNQVITSLIIVVSLRCLISHHSDRHISIKIFYPPVLHEEEEEVGLSDQVAIISPTHSIP